MRRTAASLAGSVALAAGMAFSAVPAAAHASLVSSTPEDGAVLGEAPGEVVLEFDSEVQPDFTQVAVRDAEENHYEDGDPEVEGATITQAVTDMPAGDYSISYRVGSADGHPVDGVISFTVESSEGEAAAGDGNVTEESATDDGSADAAGSGATDAPASTDESEGDASADDAADSGDAAGGVEDEDGTPVATVIATMAAIAVIGIAGVLLLRRRSDTANDDSSPDGQ